MEKCNSCNFFMTSRHSCQICEKCNSIHPLGYCYRENNTQLGIDLSYITAMLENNVSVGIDISYITAMLEKLVNVQHPIV